MDKALYIGMGGQTSSLKELEIMTNNLANVNTPGFRADYEIMNQYHMKNPGMETRVYSSVGGTYTDMRQGPIYKTGRDLDVALANQGMFAVQSASGKEGYTRAGSFDMSADGFLVTSSGQMVLGTSGAIQVANAEKITIGSDGTVAIKPIGSADTINIGKLKLVNINDVKLSKGKDGLFYAEEGQTLQDDPKIKVHSGSLEGSNVNPVETLIKLIDISRHYEIHSNMIKNMAEGASAANKLLDVKQ